MRSRSVKALNTTRFAKQMLGFVGVEGVAGQIIFSLKRQDIFSMMKQHHRNIFHTVGTAEKNQYLGSPKHLLTEKNFKESF